MQIAIIGVGRIGTRLASNLVNGGLDVLLAGRDLDKTRRFAETLGDKATALTVDEALDRADVVVLSLRYTDLEGFIADHKARFEGKIVVDPSNPLAADADGNLSQVLPEGVTAGETVAAWLPGSARYVKAFGSVLEDTLSSSVDQDPRVVLFYATDDDSAGETVGAVITASGFAPLKAGGLAEVGRIEVNGDLHLAGGLGRTVTVAEARDLI